MGFRLDSTLKRDVPDGPRAPAQGGTQNYSAHDPHGITRHWQSKTNSRSFAMRDTCAASSSACSITKATFTAHCRFRNMRAEHITRLDILSSGKVALCCMEQEGEYNLGDVTQRVRAPSVSWRRVASLPRNAPHRASVRDCSLQYVQPVLAEHGQHALAASPDPIPLDFWPILHSITPSADKRPSSGPVPTMPASGLTSPWSY